MEFHNTNTSLEKKSHEIVIHINEKTEKNPKYIVPISIKKGCDKTSFMQNFY